MFSIINQKKINSFYGIKEQLIFKQLLTHPIFYFGLGLKIFLIISLIPNIQKIWFVPFISGLSNEIYIDPWTNFLDNQGDILAFPYGIVMYLTYKFFALFGYQLDQLFNSDFFIGFSLRFSSLLFDFGTLLGVGFLAKKYSLKTLLIFYWCSPIVIYINYWHGQLDILPVFLLITCISMMHVEEPFISGIFMGLAILAKSSMLIALPFLIIFYLKNKRFIKKLKFFLIPIGLLLSANILIYFNSSGFYEMVINSPESKKLFFLDVNYGDELSLFILPTVFLIIIYIFWRLQKINLELLCVSIGIGFFSILIFLPPSPGWFLWVVPFITLFQIKSSENQFLSSIPFYFFFIIYYFLYATGANSEFLNFDLSQPLKYNLLFNDNIVGSIIFTGLQISGLIIIIKMYQFGILRNNYYAAIENKLKVGFTGNQTNIVENTIESIKKILINEWIVNLSTEKYRIFKGNQVINKNLEHNDQKLFNLTNFSKDFFNLINRKNIENETNNFYNKPSLSKNYVENSNIIFLSGFHSLAISRIRDHINLKISLEILEENLKTNESLNQKFKNLESHQKYTVDLSFYLIKRENKISPKSEGYHEQLYLKMANGFFHENLVRNLIALSSLRVDIEQSSDLDVVYLAIDGEISREDISVISKNMIINVEDLIFFESQFSKGMKGIIELIITIHIADLLHQRSF